MRRAAKIAFISLGTLLVLLAVAFGLLQTGLGRRQVLALIERQLADAPARLQARSLEGLVPFDMQLEGATLSDQRGVWLSADHLHLVWSPSTLLRGTASIQFLGADRLVLVRPPVSPPAAETKTVGPWLPDLPVAIDLEHLAVDRLELGPTLLGEPAVFIVGAKGHLGDPAHGLQAELEVRRTDQDLDRIAASLDYRSAADTLALAVSVAEPKGGLLTRLLGLGDTANLAAQLDGSGPLADWRAAGKASLDGRPLLDLTAASTGATQDRRVTFDLRLAGLPMLPQGVRPVLAGGLAAQGSLHFAGTDRPVGVEMLKVQAAAGTLDAKGTVDPAGSLDLTAELRSAGSASLAALLPPELGWGNLAASVHLGGPIAKLRTSIDATVADLVYGGNHAGEAEISATATLDTDAVRAEGLTAALTARSVALASPKLQPLVAEGVTLDIAGSLDRTGKIAAESLTLRAGALSLTGTGSAEAWGERVAHLDAVLTTSDLAPALALGGLKGGGALQATLVADKQGTALSAQLDAAASAFSSGIATLDRLLGATPKLALTVRRDDTGTISLDQAKLESTGLDLSASGTVAPDRQLALKLDGKLRELAGIAPPITGGLGIAGTVAGRIDDPNAKLQVSGNALHVDRLTVADLRATIDAESLISAPKAALQATALIDNLPASLAARIDLAGTQVNIADLRARLGAATVQGEAVLVANAATGALSFASTDLAEFGALLGQRLAGSLEGAVTLDAQRGKQSATLKATGKALRIADVAIDGAALAGSAADALGENPGLDATLSATGIATGGPVIDRLNARATGSLQRLAVTADAKGPNAAVVTAATLAVLPEQTRITLTKLEITANKTKASLQHPAQISLRAGESRIDGLALRANGGTAALDARLAADGNTISLKLERMPLAILQAAAPDLQFLGTVDGALTLEGPKAAPIGALTVQGRGLGVAGASEQLADLDLTGGWRAGQLSANGRVALSKASALDFNADLPLAAAPDGLPVWKPSAPLRASAKGQLDLGIVNAFIPGGADHIAGLATIDLAAAGTLGNPALSGEAQVANGRYDNQRYGTRLRKLTASLEGSGSALRLTSLSATTPGGGTLSGEGTIDFAGASPVNIAIRMNHARMIDAPIGTAVTDGTLSMAGSLGEDLQLSGQVKIAKAEIRIPDRLPVDVEEIPVTEVNLSPERAALLAQEDAPPPKSLRIALNLDVSAPAQVFVRGRGLDAELGGSLKIGGTADAPVISGALKLKRGDFNLLSRRLQFSSGTITFSGGARIDPVLDFVAETKLPDADVTVTVSGTATKPVIALSSAPALPQDEILARLLFGKASGALSPFEAVQLAQAMADLAGVSTGPNVLDKLRQGLGLDRLDIESGEGTSTAPSLSAGRYVSRGVFVGAKQGTAVNSSAATVEIELTPNVKLETEVGADASSKAGVNLEWNY